MLVLDLNDGMIKHVKRQKREIDHRIRSGGKGYEKLKAELAKHGLELCASYNKWYNIFGQDGNNVRYDVFDSLQDVKDWIKNDLQDYLKNGREW